MFCGRCRIACQPAAVRLHGEMRPALTACAAPGEQLPDGVVGSEPGRSGELGVVLLDPFDARPQAVGQNLVALWTGQQVYPRLVVDPRSLLVLGSSNSLLGKQ